MFQGWKSLLTIIEHVELIHPSTDESTWTDDPSMSHAYSPPAEQKTHLLAIFNSDAYRNSTCSPTYIEYIRCLIWSLVDYYANLLRSPSPVFDMGDIVDAIKAIETTVSYGIHLMDATWRNFPFREEIIESTNGYEGRIYLDQPNHPVLRLFNFR